MNSSLEKELTVGKRELEEALGERALLGEVAFSFCLLKMPERKHFLGGGGLPLVWLLH